MHGLNLSSLTGTEKEYKPRGLDIPNQYTFEDLLEVKDQGSKPWCVPYSISQTIELWHRMSGDNDARMDLADLYNRRTLNSAEGMSFLEALNSLKSFGYSLGKEYIRHRIFDFVKLPSRDQLKEFLVANLPCVMGLPVYNSNTTEFWKGAPKEGYHAVSVVGYNQEGLRILNSWGRSYGESGFVTLPWSDLLFVKEAWGILM